MAVIPCLVLVLLCSFHACNARSLRVVNKETTEEFHSKVKENDEKLNDTGVSTQRDKKYSLPKVSDRENKEDNSREEIRVSSESNDHWNKDDTKAKGDQIQVTDAAQNESLASVSWRVPHKKREDPEPGFNLDYVPPESDPPSHN